MRKIDDNGNNRRINPAVFAGFVAVIVILIGVVVFIRQSQGTPASADAAQANVASVEETSELECEQSPEQHVDVSEAQAIPEVAIVSASKTELQEKPETGAVNETETIWPENTIVKSSVSGEDATAESPKETEHLNSTDEEGYDDNEIVFPKVEIPDEEEYETTTVADDSGVKEDEKPISKEGDQNQEEDSSDNEESDPDSGNQKQSEEEPETEETTTYPAYELPSVVELPFISIQ